MKMSMEFDDEATSYLEKFQKVNLGLVKEGLQKGSSKLADEYQKAIKAEEPSEWGSINKNGRRKLSLSERKKTFGDKVNRTTGEDWTPSKGRPANIADHVKFYTPPQLDKLYAVVAGGHRSFYPIVYRNGIAVGYKPRITATSRATLDILDKLNDGDTMLLSKKQRGLFIKSLGFSPKSVKFKPRHFAEKARASGKARVLQTIKNTYEENFPKAVNAIKPKSFKVRTAI